MKVCNGNKLLISQLIDGELSPEEELQLRDHMDHCPVCRAYYDELSFVSGHMDDIDFPDDLHASIMSAVEQSRGGGKKPLRFGRKTPPVIGAVAAAIMIVFAGVIGVKSGIISFGSSGKPYESVNMSGSAETADLMMAPPQMSLKQADGSRADEEASDGEDGGGREIEEKAGRAYPVTIDSTTTGWFNSAEGNVTVLKQGNSESVIGREEALTARVEELSASLEGRVNGYGFYMVAFGQSQDLPDVFADQAGDVYPGMTLLIDVKNDLSVREQISCSMTENGFDVYDDQDGEYFTIDAEAEDGLVIIELDGE